MRSSFLWRLLSPLTRPNPALNLTPFGRWTALKRRRLALRWASFLKGMNNMYQKRAAIIFALSLIVSGCSKQEVVVQDANGNPIENALIEPSVSRMILPLMHTDKNGSVDLPRMSPPVSNVQVGHEAFKPKSADVNPEGKTIVVLEKP